MAVPASRLTCSSGAEIPIKHHSTSFSVSFRDRSTDDDLAIVRVSRSRSHGLVGR